MNNTPFSVTDRAPQKTVTNDIAANAEVQALIYSCNTNALLIKRLLPLALIVGEIDFNTASYNLEGRMRMVAGLKSALVLGMTYIVRSLIFVLGMFRSGANVDFVTISRPDYDAKMTDAAFSVSAYSWRECVVASTWKIKLDCIIPCWSNNEDFELPQNQSLFLRWSHLQLSWAWFNDLQTSMLRTTQQWWHMCSTMHIMLLITKG